LVELQGETKIATTNTKNSAKKSAESSEASESSEEGESSEMGESSEAESQSQDGGFGFGGSLSIGGGLNLGGIAQGVAKTVSAVAPSLGSFGNTLNSVVQTVANVLAPPTAAPTAAPCNVCDMMADQDDDMRDDEADRDKRREEDSRSAAELAREWTRLRLLLGNMPSTSATSADVSTARDMFENMKPLVKHKLRIMCAARVPGSDIDFCEPMLEDFDDMTQSLKEGMQPFDICIAQQFCQPPTENPKVADMIKPINIAA